MKAQIVIYRLSHWEKKGRILDICMDTVSLNGITALWSDQIQRFSSHCRS